MLAPTRREIPTATAPSIAAWAGASLCKRLLPGCPPIPPPKHRRNQYHPDSYNEIKVLHLACQPIPVPPEEVTHTGDDADPHPRPQKIEEKKSFPRHAENARQRTGN